MGGSTVVRASYFKPEYPGFDPLAGRGKQQFSYPSESNSSADLCVPDPLNSLRLGSATLWQLAFLGGGKRPEFRNGKLPIGYNKLYNDDNNKIAGISRNYMSEVRNFKSR